MLLVLTLTAAVAAAPPARQQPPAPPGAVTLETALSKARDRSPAIAAAHERDLAADRARQSVTRLPNPVVDVRGENLGAIPTTQLPRDVFATVSQPIELGGKYGARQAIASATRDLTLVNLAEVQWALDADVATLYVDALRARDVLATLVEQRESIGELVALLSQRVREGLSAEADLRRFETEHARLAAQTLRTTVALRSHLARLSAIVGEPIEPERLVTPATPALRGPAPADSDIAQRADIRAASARVQQMEATAALERTRAVPDVTATAGYKRTNGYNTATVGVSMPIGIFDRNRSAIAHAAGEVAAARFDLQLARDHALADAQLRWHAAQQLAIEAARSESDLLSPADVVRTAARSAFGEGHGDVLQLVDAERVYGEAVREAIELRLDALLAVIRARLALGDTPLP